MKVVVSKKKQILSYILVGVGILFILISALLWNFFILIPIGVAMAVIGTGIRERLCTCPNCGSHISQLDKHFREDGKFCDFCPDCGAELDVEKR